MKFKLSDKTSRFAKRTLADFSERMIVMLADMSLEEISVQKICDMCNYPRSTFYNYFDDIYDLLDYNYERYGYRKISECSWRTKHRTDIFSPI